jgi:hypothetical protein
MNAGKEIFEIMEKNQIITTMGDEEFFLNKLFFKILQSNLLKYESALDAIVFSIKSYLPESHSSEIALTGTFVITILKIDYPEIAKEALDILKSGSNSQVSPALESIFDSNEQSSFVPQSIDEVLMEIKKYEDWK